MFLKNILQNFECTIKNYRYYSKVKVRPCPRKPPHINVTVINANCNVGRMTSLLLKNKTIFKNIFLYDPHDLSEMMCDLCLINTNPKVTGFCGINSLAAAVKDARIILICDGLATKCEIDEECLFKNNAPAVRQAILYCSEFNPHALVVIATPPITSLVPMAVEEYKKADWLAGNRIFGLATTYTGRCNSICGNGLNLNSSKVHCYVVGGLHRRTCIPVLSQVKNAGIPRMKNEILTRKIQEAEEDVLHEMKQDKNDRGCYMSIAYASAKFIEKLARAIKGEKEIVACTYVQQEPPMDEYAKYFTTLCNFGPEGIISSKLPKLSELEKMRLMYVIEEIRIAIHQGETYITGNDRKTRKHRPLIVSSSKENVCAPCDAPKEEEKKDEKCSVHPSPKSMNIPEKSPVAVCPE